MTVLKGAVGNVESSVVLFLGNGGIVGGKSKWKEADGSETTFVLCVFLVTILLNSPSAGRLVLEHTVEEHTHKNCGA